MPSLLTLEARALRTHVDLFIEQIAGHLLTDPTRKLQLLALALEFNLRDHHAFEDAANSSRRRSEKTMRSREDVNFGPLEASTTQVHGGASRSASFRGAPKARTRNDGVDDMT